MAVLNYLKKQLTDFVSSFKNAKVLYEYDEVAEIHTIEVLPQSVFDSDEFAKWESDFFVRAYREIPSEDVGFISEDAYIGIDHVDWIAQGPEYEDSDSMLEEVIAQNTSDEKVELPTITPTDFALSNIDSYKSWDSYNYESFDLVQTKHTFKDSLVLTSNTTSMSFDDNLLQAA